jgi:hypothetical protein
MEEDSGLVRYDGGIRAGGGKGQRGGKGAGRLTVISVPGHCLESPIGRGRGITVGIIQSDRGDLKTGS